MSDFPVLQVDDCPVSIMNWGLESLVGQAKAIQNATLLANAYSTANTAVFAPVTIQSAFLAQKMAFDVSVQSGNCDVGIYSEAGTLLVSAGSTAVGAAGLQVIDITDTWLAAGTYFIAFNCDNSTAAFFGVNPGAILSRACGIVQQAVGAVALPNPATFATFSTRIVPAVLVAGAATI